MNKKFETLRYSEDELQEFGNIIDEKLSKAREQLAFYLEQIKNNDGSDTKSGGYENSGEQYEMDQLYSLAARQRKLIQHLENAKHRVINKTYGVCRETGSLISKERLKAVPHATLSIDAKTK